MPTQHPRRPLAGSLVLALLAALCSVVAVAAPANAAEITVSKSAPENVLAGDDVEFSLAVTNPAGPSASPEYNVTFRDVLPLGVTYVAGSTSPDTYGEPDVRTTADDRQVLIWSNISDLPVGATVELSFSATPDPVVHPVGSTISNVGDAYASTDPRTLARFSASGTYTGGATEQASSAPTSTSVSAIEVTKSEPSPENELLRGVHAHSTVYTLTTRNTTEDPTTGVTLADLIPAGLEFLGCGTTDNSAAPEYSGAPGLDAVPDVTTDCPAPTSVTTVVDPAGVPAGTYTRVEWALGTLAAGEAVEVRYRAGIPQRANTATWPGPTPGGAGLGQTANLDNNTGPSTREGAGELSLTNRATAAGTYQGALAPGGSRAVSDSGQVTVTAEDLALQKSVSPGTFTAGGIATWTLTVSTGEYADADGIVLTDVLPDGFCPLSSTENFSPAGLPACDPVPGSDPTGADFDSVTRQVDGTYEIVFTQLALEASDVATVTFQARMLGAYGRGGQDPTVSGDGYRNEVSLVGTTTLLDAVAGPAPTGPVEVADDSSAGLGSDAPALQKSIQPDVPAARPYACSTDAGDYRDDLDPTDPLVTFDEGDRVCFVVRVDFSDDNSTRNAVVTDFLPAGTTYEPGSATPTGANTVALDLAVAGDVLTWEVGTDRAGGRYVSPGGVFEVRLSAIVGDPAAGPAPDLLGNLAKLQYENTDGAVLSLRDQVDLSLAAAPPVEVEKSARRVAGTAPVPTPLPENGTVRGGDTVEYTVTVTNAAVAADRNLLDVVGPDVWDVLPAGITCDQVAAVSDSGVCTDPGDAGHPTPRAGLTDRSVVRWDLPDTVVLQAGDSVDLTYEVAYDPELSVSAAFVNTAAVSTYDSPTNQGGAAGHAPEDNIDGGVTDTDSPPAEDTHRLLAPDASVEKNLTTEVAEAGNNAGGQGTVGEQVTYTFSVVVPRGTTVYAGRLTDTLPSGVSLVPGSPSWTFQPDAASDTTAAQPGGFSQAANGDLTFPATWTNDTATDQRFAVQLTVLVSNSGNHGATRTNTASFASTAGPGGAALPARTDTAVFTLVAPSPTLTKQDDDADDVVVVGQEITYTLPARNAAGRPPLHDAFVVDCLPSGLELVAGSPTPGARDVSAGTGANGCPAGSTRIEWSLGDLGPGAVVPLTYRAVVSDTAGGSQQYTNTAELSGSTMDDDKVARADADRPTERTYSVPASRTLAVQPAAVGKEVEQPTYAIGETARWTVRVTLPSQVNFYDAAVIDQVPAGIDASTIALESATCAEADADPCTLPGAPARLADAAGPSGSTLAGWSLGDLLASPEQRVVTLVYTAEVADIVDNSRGDALVNSATLKWELADGAPPTSAGETFGAEAAPDTATLTITEPVVSLDKRVSDTTPAPGETFGYTLDVSNGAAGTGTSDAHDLVVTDDVPTGVVVDAATISDGGVLTGADAALGGGTITWTIEGPLAPGATVSLTYDAVLATPAEAGPLTNSADVTEYFSLPDQGGREYDGPQDTATVRAALPHVSVEKSVVGSTIAYIGDPLQWRIVVSSDGASTAYGVDVDDMLPPGWTYDADTARVSVAGGAPVAAEPAVTGDPQVLTWTDLGDLPTGTTLVLTFSATPGADVVTDPGVGAAVDHVNTAGTTAEDAEGEQQDADGTSYAGPDDTAAAQVHSADLAIAKEHTGTPVAGAPLTWTVTVTNEGPDPAVGPWTVVDTLPSELADAPVTASGPGWTCGRVDLEITCTRPAGSPLAVGAELAVITVVAGLPDDLADGTVLTNGAAVDGRTYDPDPANDSDTDDATVTTAADLAVDKAVSGEVVAGQDATWTIGLRNLGPSVSRAPIEVTDTLPPGSVLRSATGTGWTCDDAPGGVLTCTLSSDLAAGAPAPVLTVVAGIPSSQTGDVVNGVEITDTTTTDPEPANDADQVSTTPRTEADLGIAKTSITEVTAGEEAVYELRVVNDGPSDAAGVVVTDDLPAGLSYVGFTSQQGVWSCDETGGTVTCSLAGSLADGDQAVVRVRVAVDSSVTGAVVNEATVDADTDDPNEANNTDDDDSSVDVEADLAIDKSHTGRVLAGGQVSYVLTVSNLGPSDSPGPIVVTDTLPAGLTASTAAGPGWTCETPSPTTVICTRASSLADGTSAPDITVVADVAADAGPATLVNRATVDGPADPNPDNDTDADPTTIEDEADISITKTATDTTPVAGAETTFELLVSNAGPSDADTVTVTDTMPAGLEVVSAVGAGWTCETTAADLSCSRPTVAALTDAPVITVTVSIDSSLPSGTELTNVATTATATNGDDPADNQDDADLTLETATDLAIEKSHTGRVVAGEPVTFELDVRNQGPSDVTGTVTVVDDLPDGLGYLGVAGGQWSCEADGQQVTCEHPGPLAAGTALATLELSVFVAPDATGDLRNVAAVDPRGDDTDPGNDVDDDVVTPLAEADLLIVKSHTGPVRVGDELDFTLAVRNDGPSTARDVMVVDTLPEGLTPVSATGDDWTCDEDGQELTCVLGSPLAPDTDAPPITVTVLVEPAAYPTVTNLAEVGSEATDPEPADNTDEDEVTVPPLVNLTLDKVHEGRFVVGEQARYVLTVSNEGPTEDPGPITLTDVLPDGLTLSGVTSDDWACEGTTSVTCEYAAALPAGGSTQLVMVVDVGPEAYPEVVNTATVSTPTEESDVTDNSDDDAAAVTPTSVLTIDKRVRSSADGRVVYAITVANEGPSDTVHPLVVVDDLPAELRLVSAEGRGWRCSTQRDVARCTFPASLPAGEETMLVVVAEVRESVTAGTEVVNVAVLDDGPGVDPSDGAVLVLGEEDLAPGAADDGVLPDTGGPSAWWWLLALLLLTGGTALLRSGRRRA